MYRRCFPFIPVVLASFKMISYREQSNKEQSKDIFMKSCRF